MEFFFRKIFVVRLVLGAELIGDMPLRPPVSTAVPGGFKNMTIINSGGMEIEDNNLENWRPTDWVEVYLGEHRLQDLAVKNGIKFQVQHMGVVFQNPRIRKWYVMDFFAKSADTIANVLMPNMRPDSQLHEMGLMEKLLAYLKGEFVDHLVWDNLGYVRVREDKTGEFHDLVHLGSSRAAAVIAIRNWLIHEYTVHTEDRPVTFDMWSLYWAANNTRIRSSRNCHDFVEHVLARVPFEDTPGDSISVYRDTLALNVTSTKVLDMTKPKSRRDYQRFIRFMSNHIYESTRDIGHSAVTITKFIQLGIPFIIFLDGKNYVQVELSKILGLNYCRFPMDYVKGQEYVPSRLNDTRADCYLPVMDADIYYQQISLTVADKLIYVEFLIDELLFGDDSPHWNHLTTIFETTIWLVAIAKGLKWLRRRYSGPVAN